LLTIATPGVTKLKREGSPIMLTAVDAVSLGAGVFGARALSAKLV